MAIQFLLGRSGAGKTTEILNRIIAESISCPDNLYYLIVPEQYTLEAQRDIVTMHPNGGTMNIDAIGFNRLAYRIFDELNVNPGDVLQDFGKSMLIKKILLDKQEELLVYGSYIDKLGFVDEMKSMMSELFQYGVKRNKIESVLEDLDLVSEKNTGNKLKDINLIYEEFEKYMSGGYIVAEQMTELLTGYIKDSNIVKNSFFFFDGFTGFTPVQLMLIKELMIYAKGLIFSFTIDTDDISITNIKEHELFYMTKTAIKELSTMAGEAKVEILPNIVIDDASHHRFCNNREIDFLERQLFRYPYKKYNNSLHNVAVVSCDNAREEIYYMADRIRTLINEGYRYKDIAIVSGDISESARYYNQIMSEYDIPVFIDSNVLMKSNPCSEIIRGIIDMYAKDFSYDSVFRFLKTGMTDIDTDSIEYLENYALKRGLRGYSSWNREVPEYFEINSERNLEEIRKQFMEMLVDITPVFRDKNSTVKDYVEALYAFLIKIDIPHKLAHKSAKLNDDGKFDEGNAYSQIMVKVVDLFDKVVQLLSDENMSVKEFGDIIDTGLSEIEIGIVPPTVDRVLVGDITRSRLNHVKVLFLAGVNEGIIPKAAKQGKILVDSDRANLEKHGIVLAPSDRINAYVEQFYLYMNITKPSDRLYISYRKTGKDDKGARPSYLISRIMNIFPRLEVESFNMEEEKLYTDRAILRYIVRDIRDNGIEGVSSELYKLIKEHGYDKELDNILSGSNYCNTATSLTKETLMLLYGNSLIQSVSRLETFANCKYAYFLKYELGLKERDKYDIDIRHVGSILHQVMEKVFNNVKNTMGNDWEHLAEDVRSEMVQSAVCEAASQYGGSFFDDYARNNYMLTLLTNMAQHSVEVLQKHLCCGYMKPGMIEKVFNSDKDDISEYIFNLKNDMKLILNGKIDRVDTYEKNGKVYIKVIDYKSSSKDLALEKILSGLQLQLCVYAGVAYELEKKMYPDKDVKLGGLLYYSFDDPIIEAENLDIDDESGEFVCNQVVDGMKLDSAKLKGYVNSDEEVLSIMDNTLSIALPIKLDKNNSVKAAKNIFSEEKLLQLLKHTRVSIKEIGEDIAAGSIDISPSKFGKETGCDYCNFRDICRFDTKYGGNSYNIISKDIIDIFCKEEVENELD